MLKPMRIMSRVLLCGALVVGTALAGGAAFAHHSFAMFDSTKEITLDGVVREFQWTNPHSWVQLTVLEEGKSVEYSIEGGSPNGLSRRGWTRKSLNAGDHVKIVMNPLKDGQKGGSFKRAIFPDGRVLGNN